MAEIIPIISESSDANSYLILDSRIALIDTGAGIDRNIIDKISIRLDPTKIDLIINTHGHADHCGGNSYFNDASVLAHIDEIKEMEKGTLYGTYYLRGKKTSRKVDQNVKEDQTIKLGDFNFKVIHTPGHTPGGICLLEENERTLFTGDTLFPNGNFGRVDLGGNRVDMINSLKKISEVDFDVLCSGHGEPTKNGHEQAILSAKNAMAYL